MVTWARAEELQRSRQRLIAAQEGARREIALRLRREVHEGLIPEAVRLAAYRIAEEALTNLVKDTRAPGPPCN